jgi:DNA-binding transcriptional ArsR family regulator
MTLTTEVFRALADPTRRAVFERLAHGGESSVMDLKAQFHVSQPAISQHLSTLRGAGLVVERREGRNIYYRVQPAGLAPLIDWIEHYQSFWHNRLEHMKTLLQELDQ